MEGRYNSLVVIPLVSVVIPTLNRPHLVTRAVQSAISQSWQNIQIIVVVDGKDETTRQKLSEIIDPRLSVIPLPQTIGPAQARNAGVRVARGEWIAFLDDDDEWLAEKLERQLAVANQSSYAYPIILCQAIARTEKGNHLVPRRLPKPGEAVCEYLFCQHGLRGSEGMFIPSTLLAPKDLLLNIPLRTEAGSFEGSDWALRATRVEGAGIEFVRAGIPLAIWHAEENREHLSMRISWKVCLSWARSNRNLMTPNAYAGFLMTWLGSIAVRQGDWSAFFILPWEAFRRSRVRAMDIIAYLLIWLVPTRLRSLVVRLLEATKMIARSDIRYVGLERAE